MERPVLHLRLCTVHRLMYVQGGCTCTQCSGTCRIKSTYRNIDKLLLHHMKLSEVLKYLVHSIHCILSLHWQSTDNHMYSHSDTTQCVSIDHSEIVNYLPMAYI